VDAVIDSNGCPMSGAERMLDAAPGAASLYPRAAFGTFARPLLRKVPLVGGSTPKALPELTLGLDDVALDAGHVADYARVCGFGLRDTLPPSYLHILGFPLAMSLMTDGAFPFGVIGLVHVANRIDHVRPVALGETPSLRVHAEDLREHAKGRQFDVVAVATVGGECVWEGRSTYLRVGGGTGAGDGAAAKDDKKPERPAPVAGAPPEAIWAIPADIGRRYGAVSGDRNPIHLHNVSAKLFGMPRAIAHGMWLKARVLAALQPELPDSFTAEVRFKRPVLLPAKVAFSTTKQEGGRAFALHDAKRGIPHLDGSFRA
jgi:acyl dehydratase